MLKLKKFKLAPRIRYYVAGILSLFKKKAAPLIHSEELVVDPLSFEKAVVKEGAYFIAGNDGETYMVTVRLRTDFGCPIVAHFWGLDELEKIAGLYKGDFATVHFSNQVYEKDYKINREGVKKLYGK